MAASVRVACVAALALGACAVRDPIVGVAQVKPAGNWQIESQTDRITGKPISNARVIARASHTNQILPQPAAMHLLCFKSDPVVRVVFSQRVGSTHNADVGVSFDGKPGYDISPRFVEDFRSFVIEDPAELSAFVQNLANAQTVYFRIRSLTRTARSSVEFKVDGAPAAIAAAYETCPVKPPEPEKPKMSKGKRA